jgi:hypothetical protein
VLKHNSWSILNVHVSKYWVNVREIASPHDRTASPPPVACAKNASSGHGAPWFPYYHRPVTAIDSAMRKHMAEWTFSTACHFSYALVQQLTGSILGNMHVLCLFCQRSYSCQVGRGVFTDPLFKRPKTCCMPPHTHRVLPCAC